MGDNGLRVSLTEKASFCVARCSEFDQHFLVGTYTPNAGEKLKVRRALLMLLPTAYADGFSAPYSLTVVTKPRLIAPRT